MSAASALVRARVDFLLFAWKLFVFFFRALFSTVQAGISPFAAMASPGFVYVRFNSNAQMSVPIDTLSSVKSIKEAVARHHGVPPSEIRLIFAGHELNESMTLAV